MRKIRPIPETIVSKHDKKKLKTSTSKLILERICVFILLLILVWLALIVSKINTISTKGSINNPYSKFTKSAPNNQIPTYSVDYLVAVGATYASNDKVLFNELTRLTDPIKWKEEYKEELKESRAKILREQNKLTIMEEDKLYGIDTGNRVIDITVEEQEILCRIVEAEVTGESYNNLTKEQLMQCKINVAQVIIHRVKSDKFPNSIEGVVFQKNPTQFSPIDDGRYNDVNITALTREAVKLALDKNTADNIPDALYFMKGAYGKKQPVLIDEVGHRFYN